MHIGVSACVPLTRCLAPGEHIVSLDSSQNCKIFNAEYEIVHQLVHNSEYCYQYARTSQKDLYILYSNFIILFFSSNFHLTLDLLEVTRLDSLLPDFVWPPGQE